MARVACSPAPWGDTLFERVLDDVADLGYHGVEANRQAVEEFARHIPRLRGLLAERSLTLTAVPLTGSFFEKDARGAEIDELRRLGDFLAEVNEGALVVFRTVSHSGRRDMIAGEPPLLPLTRDRLARLADTLNEYCDRCRDFGLRGAVQNRVGSYLETPDEYLEVVERTEPELVGLAPDLGHWAYAGGDVDQLVREHRTRIVYPRLKDLRRAVFQHVVDEHLGFRSFLEAGGIGALGEGDLALEAPLLRLENAAYAGWVCVEQDPSPTVEDAKANAQVSREYLRARLHW
jgi:inosose dehydratase